MAGQTMKSIGAAVSVGLAAWCSLGALGLADRDGGASRVALLAPWWILPLFLIAAFAAIRWTRPSAAPLDALLGSTLILLPWLPIPLPAAALLWTGPFLVAVWIAVILGVVASRARTEPGTWLTQAHRAPFLAATLALVLYGASAWWLAPILPDGDAPHYLIMTQSLIGDGDLKIENNHRRGDDVLYTLFAAEPDYLERGRNGAIYSIHAPGLSVLLVPAFLLFGYSGAVAFLGLIGAAGTALVWYLGLRVTGSAAAAWFGWGCAALTTPFFFQATQVFPDGVAASLVLLGALPLIAGDFPGTTAGRGRTGDRFQSDRLWLVAGVALAILPWLQTRLVLIAASCALCVCLRGRHVRQVALFAAVPALSAIGWFGFFYVIYGTPNPAAPYGALTQTSIGRLVVGFPGLLFDQQFGVIPNAPVYGVVFAGVVAGAIRLRRWCWEVLVIVTPYLVGVGMFQIWFGGSSSPARLVAPCAMLLGVAAARIFRATRTSSSRAVQLLALGVSVLITAVLGGPDRGRLLFNARDGVALWIEWSNDLVDLPRALPSLFRDTPGQAWLKAAVWGACLAVAWLALKALERRERVLSHAGDGWLLSWRTIWTLAAGVMVALTLVWRIDRASPLTPATAELGLLGHASRLRPLAYDYQEGLDAAPRRLGRLRIRTDRIRRPLPPELLLSASNVPAGTYQIAVDQSEASRGSLVMRMGTPSMAVWTAPVSDPAGILPIRLPVDVAGLTVESDDPRALAASSVELRPLGLDGLFAPARPVTRGLAHRAVAYGTTRVFFMDDYAYAEPSGFWVAGGRTAEIVLGVDSRSSTLDAPRRVFLRNIPLENHLTIAVDGVRHEVPLQPREEAEIDLPPSRRSADVVLRLESVAGIRPSQADPGSRDLRYLGCWVEIR